MSLRLPVVIDHSTTTDSDTGTAPVDPLSGSNENTITVMIDDPATGRSASVPNDAKLNGDLCTPIKKCDNKGVCGKNANSSRSSSSSSITSNTSTSGSGGDNNYNADYSGDGGSDDNQSSDDTSGTRTKQPHPMMLDSSAMIAHHQYHNKQKGSGNKYDNNYTSSGSSSSNDDDDDDDGGGGGNRGKDKLETAKATSVGLTNRSHQDGIEQAQQQLSALSTNVNPKSELPKVNHCVGGSTRNGAVDSQQKIDLSLVNHIPSSSLILPLHETATAALLQWNQHDRPQQPAADTTIVNNTILETNRTSNMISATHLNNTSSVPLHNTKESGNGCLTTPMLTVQNYMHLMEAVRPFFHIQGMTYPQYFPCASTYTAATQHNTTKENDGHTAYQNNCDNLTSSEGFTSFFTTTTDESGGDKKVSGKGGSTVEDRYEATEELDDNSSMAVLARAKRKYVRNLQETYAATTTSSSDASSSTPRDRQHIRGHSPAADNNNNNDHTKNLPLMITDASSSNPTTTSGSGSGDNGMNTTTGGSGSGTGSNQGSSGSGNDGKGSSEELAKEDSNSGGDGMNGSDGSNNITNHRGNQNTTSLPDESNVNLTDKRQLQNQLKNLSAEARDALNEATTTTTRAQKMLVKKRKRIVMRREYEAQQRQMSSSESSSDSTESYFAPGRPLTLDQVLVFSKIPRLVVQGTPPFLIVHKNAACCRLTGIDAHLMVGKSISTLLSIPLLLADDDDLGEVEINSESKTEVTNIAAIPQPADEVDAGKTAAACTNQSIIATFDRNEKQTTIDRLILACGCGGSVQVVNVRTKLPSKIEDPEEQEAILCRLFVAPIVASKDMVSGGHDFKRARHQQPETDQAQQQDQEKILKMPIITHFVIQFEQYGNDQQHSFESIESLSSANSIDEQSSRYAKANVPTSTGQLDEATSDRLKNSIVESNINQEQSNSEITDIDGSMSVQSSDRDPIVAIG